MESSHSKTSYEALKSALINEDSLNVAKQIEGLLVQGASVATLQQGLMWLYQTGRYSHFVGVMAKVMQKSPSFESGYKFLAHSYRSLKQHTNAINLLRQALAYHSDKASIHNQLGILYREIGELEQASVCFKSALEIKPDFSEASYNLVRAQPGKDLLHTHNLKERFSNAESNKDKAFYAFAIAKQLSSSPDEYVHWLHKANEIQRKIVPYNGVDELEALRAIKKKFSHSELDKSDNSSAQPIFIVGMPRSGTTLIEQILAAHSEVTAGDELFEFARCSAEVAAKYVPRTAFPHWLGKINTEALNKVADRYLENTAFLQTATYFTDKMPQNFKAVGLIHQVFPNAKVIHCRRSPMDTIWSCYEQNFGLGNGFANSLDDLTDYYIEYDKLMSFFEDTSNGAIFTLEYEALIANPKKVICEVLSFLGLDYQQSCEHFYEGSKVVHTVSDQQVRKPIYTSSVQKWRKYETHLSPYQRKLK
ncbi:hypothetical protein N480_05285 [Pseudoalteromonas luteoviolacea S2607]|uniref:sulfotransferase family protein n=1 Tax=Pseudoalteromonas luteoviolacea TaxID=43657 RepID=UPI0007B05B38|nr:sulfotransferase [Pseudoalteromonas luteoviolacea]KZN30365.1 hypothetical protein N480_05285 [Pseudoalteromonas luteoviolacea S2607]